MEKDAARKKSQDPVQESLRQEKSVWNKEVTELIDNLINFKKLMNGQASKFNMQKSRIIDPIPANPVNIISDLATKFRDIAVESNNIAAKQIEYSKTRRKKQPKKSKTPTVPETVVQQPDLSKQLAASADYHLQTEGSNPLSRFFSSLKGTFSRDEDEKRLKRFRLQLLRKAVRLEKEYGLLQVEIISKSPESLFAASQLLDKIDDTVASMDADVAAFAGRTEAPKNEEKSSSENESKPPQSTEKPPKETKSVQEPKKEEEEKVTPPPISEKPSPPKPPVAKAVIEAAKMAAEDMKIHKPAFLDIDPALYKVYRGAKVQFDITTSLLTASDADKDKAANVLLSAYNNIINDLKSKLQLNGATLAELKADREKKANDTSYALESLAQNTLKKWYRKLKHSLWSDDTTANRRDIFDICKRCIADVKQMQDDLEEALDVGSLQKHLSYLKSENEAMEIAFTPLAIKIKKQRFNRPFLDLLRSRKLSDLDLDIDPEMAKALERKMRAKQISQLTKRV